MDKFEFDHQSRPRKSGDMSDMAHRIKTMNQPPKEIISSPPVAIEPKTKLAGYGHNGQPMHLDISSTDD